MTFRTTIRLLTPSRLALTLGLAASLGLGVSAQAQTATSPTTPAEVPAPTKAPADQPMPHHGSRGLNAYLDKLHADLKITADEEPLWVKFAATMRDNAAQLGQAYRDRRDKLPTMTALEDMNSFIDVEQMRLDGMKRSSAAFADLYKAMPAAQQKVADAIFLADLPGGPHKGHKRPHKAPDQGGDAAPAPSGSTAQ